MRLLKSSIEAKKFSMFLEITSYMLASMEKKCLFGFESLSKAVSSCDKIEIKSVECRLSGASCCAVGTNSTVYTCVLLTSKKLALPVWLFSVEAP